MARQVEIERRPRPFDNASPLRYPGGKGRLAPVLESIINLNGLRGCTYAEPFAGGSGAAIRLLLGGVVSRIVLNDVDPLITNFWKATLEKPQTLIRRLRKFSPSVEAWREHHGLLFDGSKVGAKVDVDRAFAYLIVNRCNRSGIMNAGPIGGISQSGEYKIDARLYVESLVRRFRAIERHSSAIEIHSRDAADFIKMFVETESVNLFPSILYMDPPYFVKGRDLYKHYFAESDHARLAALLQDLDQTHWVLSYDNVPSVSKRYAAFQRYLVDMQYSAREAKKAKELFVASSIMSLPTEHFIAFGNPS